MTTEVLKLRVMRQAVLSSWTKNGKEVTLYSVGAVDENDQKPDREFRSFQELPIDELVEYTATRYEHPEHGVSWTLKKPSSGLGAQLADLQTVVDVLAERVEKLERRLGDPEPDMHPAQKNPDAPRGPSMLPPIVDKDVDTF